MFLDAKKGEVYSNPIADAIGLSDDWEFLTAPYFVLLFTPFALVAAYQLSVVVPVLAAKFG